MAPRGLHSWQLWGTVLSSMLTPLLQGQTDDAGTMPHGRGTMTHADGSTHAGRWRRGVAHGPGCFKHANGFTYHGSFRSGVAHGCVFVQCRTPLMHCVLHVCDEVTASTRCPGFLEPDKPHGFQLRV